MKPTSTTEATQKAVYLGKEEKPTISVIDVDLQRQEKFSITMTPDSECSMEFPAEVPKNLWACHYVSSVLSVICCFNPLSVLGIIHLLSAQTEYRLGHTASALSKKRQAKVWTALSWVLGLLVVSALLFNCFGLPATSWSSESTYAGKKTTVKPAALATAALFLPELQYEINQETKQERETAPRHEANVSPFYVAELQREMEEERKKLEKTTPFVAELQYEEKKERSTQKPESNTHRVFGADWRNIVPPNIQ